MRSRLLAVVVAVAFSSGVARADIVSMPRAVDVVVTDAGGRHLTGLAQTDFEILEDGVHRDIAGFAADSRAPRSILLVVDSGTISLSARKTILAAFRDFVAQHLRPIDQVMVVSILQFTAMLPMGQWTSNKDEVLKQLDKAEGVAIGNKAYERVEAERAIQLALDTDKQSSSAAAPTGLRGGFTMNSSQITFEQIMQPGRQYAELMRQRARASNDAIRDALAQLRTGPGKKVAIIAGGGLSTHPGSDIFQFLDEVRQRVLSGSAGGVGALRGAQTTNPLAEVSRYDVTSDVKDVAESARDRGITVYTIDVDRSGSSDASIERTMDASVTKDFAGAGDLLSGYMLLSTATGGTTTGGRGTTTFEQIAEDLESHYVLTYTQTLTDKGTLPKLVVRSTKPGARVRFGYAGGPATKDSEVKDLVVANHAAPNLTNDLHIALKSDEPITIGDARHVKVHVLIPVKSLKFTTAGPEASGGFVVYVSTGDPTGNASEVDRQTKELRFPAEKMPSILDKTVEFVVEVVMNPGRTQISVGVIDQHSQQTGFAKAAI